MNEKQTKIFEAYKEIYSYFHLSPLQHTNGASLLLPPIAPRSPPRPLPTVSPAPTFTAPYSAPYAAAKAPR